MRIVIKIYDDGSNVTFDSKTLHIGDESEISEKITDIEDYLFAQYFELEEDV